MILSIWIIISYNDIFVFGCVMCVQFPSIHNSILFFFLFLFSIYSKFINSCLQSSFFIVGEWKMFAWWESTFLDIDILWLDRQHSIFICTISILCVKLSYQFSNLLLILIHHFFSEKNKFWMSWNQSSATKKNKKKTKNNKIKCDRTA